MARRRDHYAASVHAFPHRPVTGVTWIVNGYPWPGDPVGGIFFKEQASALARLGVPITVLSPTPYVPWPLHRLRAHWRLYAESPSEAIDQPVRVLRPRYPNVPGQPDWARADRTIAAAAWRVRQRWDEAGIIHGHYAVTGLAAWHVARRRGMPFFLTFHGDDINTWPGEHPARCPDLSAAVAEASGVFAVSEALAERVYEVTGVQAIHLPIGSDHRWINESSLPKDEARRRLGLPLDRLIVLFVGYLLPQKGVRELASAILDVGDPILGVFVGDGPERDAGVDAPGGRERLRYQGARSHADVICHMAAADVIVLPSYREGLPTVLVEAGSVGLPVIASAAGGIPELLGSDRGTLLPEVSRDAIAEALRYFCDHQDDATGAAGRLRDHVLTEYDIDVNAARLLERYRAAVPSTGGAA